VVGRELRGARLERGGSLSSLQQPALAGILPALSGEFVEQETSVPQDAKHGGLEARAPRFTACDDADFLFRLVISDSMPRRANELSCVTNL